MVASVSSPADLANNALARLGYKLRVGSLLDGSDHANSILDIYSETRDEMLRNFDYDFAQRTAALVQLKAAPIAGYFPPNQWDPNVNPPLGFAFEYGYPDDALKIRVLKPSYPFLVNMDPTSNRFTEYNDDNYATPRRTILSNIAGAIAVYTGQVTDPATWDVAYSGAFAAELAKRIGPALVSLDNTRFQEGEARSTLASSQMDGR